MLLVNGLTADLQHVRDRLPAPALLSRVAHLHRLEAVSKGAEGTDCGESLCGVSMGRGPGELVELGGCGSVGDVHSVK